MYRDPNGTQRGKSFGTEKEAKCRVAANEAAITSGTWIKPELVKQKFSYLSEQWLAGATEGLVKLVFRRGGRELRTSVDNSSEI
jgi:hypothetical protein